jgi:hypothetical protein
LGYIQQCPVCLEIKQSGAACVNRHFICDVCATSLTDPDRMAATRCPVCRVVGALRVSRPHKSDTEAPATVVMAMDFLFGLLLYLNGRPVHPKCQWDYSVYPVLSQGQRGEGVFLSFRRACTTKLMQDSSWKAGFPVATLVELQFTLNP